MFCKNCGNRLDDDARFCDKCGTAIQHAAESTAPLSTASEADVPANTDIYTAADTGSYAAAEKKGFDVKVLLSDRRIIIAAASALVLIILALVLIFALPGGDSDKVYHDLNFVNTSQFAYDSDRLYLIGKYNSDDENSSVFSTDYKGLNKQLISDNDDINGIRVVDDKIFFRTVGDTSDTLGYMNKDGSGVTTLVTVPSDQELYYFDVAGDTFYYLSENQVRACDLSGEDDHVVIASAKYFALYKNSIYYTDGSLVSVYDLKRETTTELCTQSEISALVVNDGTLYFTCADGLCSASLKNVGTATVVIADSEISYYVFHDEHIYYIHNLTSDEKESVANAVSQSSDYEYFTVYLMLAMSGEVYRTEMDGSNPVEMEHDLTYLASIFTYPDGFYGKFSVFTDTAEPIIFTE